MAVRINLISNMVFRIAKYMWLTIFRIYFNSSYRIHTTTLRIQQQVSEVVAQPPGSVHTHIYYEAYKELESTKSSTLNYVRGNINLIRRRHLL